MNLSRGGGLRLAVLLAGLAAGDSLALAGPLSDSLLLVARPEYSDPVYGRTLLIVAPFSEDQHYGFILNRPTVLKLGQLFPDDAAAQNVTDPVFLGGTVYVRMIFALVQGPPGPTAGCVQMMPTLCAVFEGRSVDRVIATRSTEARFFTGFVVWRPGELLRELAAGLWYVLEPDAALVTREPRGLWEELVRRAQREVRLSGGNRVFVSSSHE